MTCHCRVRPCGVCPRCTHYELANAYPVFLTLQRPVGCYHSCRASPGPVSRSPGELDLRGGFIRTLLAALCALASPGQGPAKSRIEFRILFSSRRASVDAHIRRHHHRGRLWRRSRTCRRSRRISVAFGRPEEDALPETPGLDSFMASSSRSAR